MHKIGKNWTAIFIGFLIAFLIAEVTLRIYNPLPSRVKGNKIQLVTNLKRKFVVSPPIKGLETKLNYSTNSLGFRGVEPSENFADDLTIITVGGSTTECSMIDDEKTWPQLLYYKLKNNYSKVWLNNAGLDGCSTYGHLVLLDDYVLKLKPDFILFLIGVNDVGIQNAEMDLGLMTIKQKSLFMTLASKSETINLINTIYRNNIANRYNLPHQITTAPDSTVSKFSGVLLEKQEEVLDWNRAYLPKYKSRVELLVNRCIENDIVPILITQPLFDGYSTFGWNLMKLYNQTTKDVAKEKNIPLIDLATKLEKKAEYFYDNTHYTIIGANKVSEIVFENLNCYLQDHYVQE